MALTDMDVTQLTIPISGTLHSLLHIPLKVLNPLERRLPLLHILQKHLRRRSGDISRIKQTYRQCARKSSLPALTH